MIRDYTNDIIKEMIKRFITGLYEWLEFTYTDDIVKVMIKDLLLDYMNDQILYEGYYTSDD